MAVNVGNVTAYQTKPAFNPDQDRDIQSPEAVTILDEVKTVQQQLSPEEKELLTQAIIGLGHLGEGHCKAKYKQ